MFFLRNALLFLIDRRSCSAFRSKFASFAHYASNKKPLEGYFLQGVLLLQAEAGDQLNSSLVLNVRFRLIVSPSKVYYYDVRALP